MDDVDVKLMIPVAAVYDEFMCPVCLSPITDAFITPCGHNACWSCLSEWVARAHSCPVCRTESLTEEKLVKNHWFDKLLNKIQTAKEAASKAYFAALTAGGTSAGAGSGAGAEPGSTPATTTTTTMSPIESIFHTHMHRSLGQFNAYLQKLEDRYASQCGDVEAEYARRVEDIRASHKAALRLQPTDPASPPLLPPDMERSESLVAAHAKATAAMEWRKTQLQSLKASHDISTKALCDEYERYMSTAAPSPAVVPTTAFILVPDHGWRFQCEVGVVTYVHDLEAVLRQRVKELGDDVVSFGDDALWRLSSPSVTFLAGTPLVKHVPDGRLPPGAEIVFSGGLFLKSQEVKKCFAQTFEKGTDQVTDYFTCVTCSSNWICGVCVGQCHDGHDTRPYLRSHKPSYACCYCRKKKLCKISGK